MQGNAITHRLQTLGPVAVTDNGKVIAHIFSVEANSAIYPVASRKLRKSCPRLFGKHKGGTDSSVSRKMTGICCWRHQRLALI